MILTTQKDMIDAVSRAGEIVVQLSLDGNIYYIPVEKARVLDIISESNEEHPDYLTIRIRIPNGIKEPTAFLEGFSESLPRNPEDR